MTTRLLSKLKRSGQCVGFPRIRQDGVPPVNPMTLDEARGFVQRVLHPGLSTT